MSVSQDSAKNDDGLHALYLSLNDRIVVFLLRLRERKEVDRAEIAAHV